MEHISPDSILLPKTLCHFTYSKLISLLSENGTWKKVAQTFGIFSKNDIDKIGRTRDPAETLILELGARLCPVGFFCNVLKECNLYNILMLFNPLDPVIIIEKPFGNHYESRKVKRGTELVLICRALGPHPLNYQWYCNNEKIESQREPILSIDNFGLEDEGKYFCIVSQDGCSNVKTSNSVNVTLALEPPVFLAQPVPSIVCRVGAKVVLSVTATGHPKLTYQWYRGGTEINNSNTPKLVLNVEDKSFDGAYRCYIWNAAGGLWSHESALTVTSAFVPEPSAKVAVLIANETYDNLSNLHTPTNDVTTLAQILKGLGFHTVALQNLNLKEMRNIIYHISEILPNNAYVLFYYSGHGFEICDKFMLPVDVPGPEDFLQTHGFSERELLRAILKSKPMLFLEFLDMCLKPPKPSNKKIFSEKVSLYEYSASHNLIQAYATTSNSSAYEKRTDENGLYVKHLKEYFSKNSDMPIVEILRNVAKDIAKVCPIQKPFFGTNVTMDYRLTDTGSDNTGIGEKIKALSVIPPDFILPFKQVGINSKVSLTPFRGVFFNTLELRFSHLRDFKVNCEVPGDELSLELSRRNGEVFIKIINIQRLISERGLTLHLYRKNGLYLDKAVWVIKKPMIAVINLREKALEPSREKQGKSRK